MINSVHTSNTSTRQRIHASTHQTPSRHELIAVSIVYFQGIDGAQTTRFYDTIPISIG